MIFHLSIEADHPAHVASVLAEIIGGEALPFPPVAKGSWVAHGGDSRNSIIEVYPRGTQLHRGEAGAVGLASAERRNNPTHFALGTVLDEAAVHEIGAREGWHVETFSRDGLFHVIELWIDGCQMIELLTSEFQREYLENVSIEKWKALLAAGPVMAEAA